jgi:hypothetical protein
MPAQHQRDRDDEKQQQPLQQRAGDRRRLEDHAHVVPSGKLGDAAQHEGDGRTGDHRPTGREQPADSRRDEPDRGRGR